ncbi:MurR/RpiR family transcriptional regulator [Rhizobium cremeum]|uniref:MurR/RpiR family transcriptional regulator n=1 Tax=Rhizobium cremeum TaxID=2813827 RepID=UPI000DDABABF|nr:MurR/RpiR family transcriptional regulator [Rhizobium cremeum]MCJ7995594.1 MurR/RpiR family transcriptional regulator [Rhizobium cremeum]MCJ8001092.1 MurR/RpiR family transcriptional regulator [Rhizobium cremeum]
MSDINSSPRVKDRFAEQLAKRRGRLSPSLLRVAEFIDAHRHRVLGLSALEIGFETGASDATVIRAIQSLGYSGLRELKDVLEAWLGETDSPIEKMAATLRDVDGQSDQAIDFVLQTNAQTMEALASAENRKAIAGMVRLLVEAQEICFFGIGASGLIAEYAARLFSRSGLRSHVLNATGIALAEQLMVMREGQLLIMMLHGRAHREAMAAIAEAERLRIPIVMFLGKQDSPLRDHAREAVILPRAKSERIALHAPSLIAAELLHVAYSAVQPDETLQSLERLIELRGMVRPNSK